MYIIIYLHGYIVPSSPHTHIEYLQVVPTTYIVASNPTFRQGFASRIQPDNNPNLKHS